MNREIERKYLVKYIPNDLKFEKIASDKTQKIFEESKKLQK